MAFCAWSLLPTVYPLARVGKISWLIMQIIRLEHGDWNFYCPVTGKPVYGEQSGVTCDTFRGGWHHEVPSEPMNLAPQLEEAWKAYVDKIDLDEDSLDVATFLDNVDIPGWVAFEVHSFGMACGPVWETTWTVLDLNDPG